MRPSTAAASCWEIKQLNSASPDGVYWILTPQLQVPTQIYCDQTTDGGGWELIGRGRENWTYNYNGKGTPAEVATTVTGTAAFSPKQLDSTVINGLLGGKRFDDPTYGSGVRIRRATNQTGTAWQETRWTYRANSRDRWSWALGAGFPLATVNIGGSTGSNLTTYEFGADTAYKRLWTYENVKNNYVRGFNFGQNGIGSTASDSYIYSEVGGGAYGTPFSQVFIRPKLMSSDLTFTPVPDAGTPAQTIRAVPRNGSLSSSWGVTGLGNGGTTENATEVQAFAQIGNTMYVGGNFTTVLKGASATGDDRVAQPYLAAFDATTGDFIRSFTPQLNSMVKSLTALPNGKLAVGGEFTQVSGTARSGLVVLDPQTGALDPSWTTNLENRVSGGVVSVRGLDTDGTYLYLTGSFTHFVKPGSSDRYAKNGARIALSTGTADNSWNPEFNGTGTALDVSDDKSTVYFSGYFTQMKNNTQPADRAAAISTASGAAKVANWQPTFSTAGSARYQQAIQQVGSKVWLGGSQHSMFSYNPSTFALENKHITKAGGDLQAITGGNGLVFGGCHCENWVYSDTTAYDSTNPGGTNITWTQADKTYYVGAWDAKTGDFAMEFTPEMRARNGLGAWALKVAKDGTLWAGGSITSSVKENGSNQWIGGFVRYAPRPSTAPGAPTALKATLAAGSATLTWSAGSSSDVTYEVLRNDRVVATTTSTTVTVPGSTGSDRYVVRAADSWGNRSASTAVAVPAAAPVTTTLVPAGSAWAYYFSNTAAVGTDWNRSFFDDSAWATGTAPLGWGTGPIATNIDVPAGQTRAVASYYRKKFTIAPGSTFGAVTLTTRADDGVAVYVNGVEMTRANLPAGTLTGSTYASSAPSTATAVANPVTYTVPVSALRIGTNTVSVEVHSMYRTTPSSSMDLSLVAEAGSQAPAAETTTTPLVAVGSAWSYFFDSAATVPTDWTTSASATSAWRSGAAPLGWGTSGPIATNIDVPAGGTRALTSYYRRSFTVADASAVKTLKLTTRADDGVAVYVNGVEVTRSNLPAGTLTPTTYASSAVSTAAATSNPVTFDVPLGLLQTGANSIAVEVHSNYRSTPNASMDLSLVATS
nr:fibrinogen-like YCDxxxxGGGW domain-containing protein [Aeromicrobium stalagmiti]